MISMAQLHSPFALPLQAESAGLALEISAAIVAVQTFLGAATGGIELEEGTVGCE